MTKRWARGFAVAAFLSVSLGLAQTNSFKKNFNLFKEVAPGIDFYASSKADIASFEKPVREAQQKIASLVDRKLARGAIVICTTMEQKDSVQETRMLKLGYSWVLIQLTPQATAQQMVTQIKARLGNMAPPGLLEMIQNRPPEQKAADKARMIDPTVQRMCFALLETTLMPEKVFKSSRIDDLSRSPLADWLDVGVAWYGSGAGLSLRFLQDRLDEIFPLEDVLAMPRPFVAPQGDSGPGAGSVVIRTAGGGSGAGTGPGALPPGGSPSAGVIRYSGPPQPASGTMGGGESGMQLAMPKDVQDRMAFDSQAASFFSFIVQKMGVQKVRSLVQSNLDGKDTLQILAGGDFLGSDMEKVEKDWREWVKSQKPEEPVMFRINPTPGKAPVPPH